MKSGESYRFTLGWGAQTEDGILAGEFLNALGNKKSRFLIKLVADYVREHPDGMEPDGTIRVVLESSTAGRELIEKVKAMVLAELEGKVIIQSAQDGAAPEPAQEETDVGVSFMLDSLDNWGLEE